MNKTYGYMNILVFLMLLIGCDEKQKKIDSSGTPEETSAKHDTDSGHGHSQDSREKSGDGEEHSGLKCSVHKAAKEDCWICDASLRDKNRLWCKEHNTYEDRCWKCHPELQDKNRLYCKEHGVYEDECILCHPELKKSSSAPTKQGNKQEQAVETVEKGLYCKEHKLLEKECAICHPELLGGTTGKGLKVRFPSSQAAEKAGLQTEPVKSTSRSQTTSNGFFTRVDYNQNRMTHVVPKTGGTVGKIFVDNGTQVKKGQILGYFSSPEAAEAKSNFLVALADSSLKATAFKREKNLEKEKVSSLRELEVARAEYKRALAILDAAYHRLSDLGLDPQEINELRRVGKASSTLVLRAPFDGTVIERKAVSGGVFPANTALFTLVDLSQMWLDISIPARLALQLQLGERVMAQFSELGPGKIPAKITWIASEINEDTRMVKVRAEIPNPGRQLKKGLFGRVELMNADVSGQIHGTSVEVPQNALQRIEGKDYVFIPLEEDLFEARQVHVSGRNNKQAVISAGLQEGEPVVVAGSFTVRSEMFKSRLGAGCEGH